MIAIVSKPPDYCFAGNPVQYEISSGASLAIAGTKAQLILKVSAFDTIPNHQFTLVFDNQSLVFKLKSFPSDDGLDLQQMISDLATYVGCIFTGLAGNYQIKSNYDLTLTGPTNGYYFIHLTAKETGAIWTIDITNNQVTALTKDSMVSGVDTVAQDNFGILCSVWTNSAGPNQRGNAPVTIGSNSATNNLMKIGEDMKSVDASGRVSFDISDYLRTYLKLKAEGSLRFTYPEVATQNVTEWPNHVVQFITSFAERYSNQVRKLSYDLVKYVINGGLSREALAYFNESETDYFSVSDNHKRFLTWAPLVKTTGKSQPEKLSFFLCGLRVPYSYRLAIKVKFTDGTTNAFYATDAHSYSVPVLLECMVGYNHLNLGSMAISHDIESWEVWMEDAYGSVISEVRKFILDTDYYEHERTFLFRNSFGGYDTIRFLGYGESTLAYERISGNVISDEVITSFNAPVKNFDSWETESFKVNSGFVSKETREYYRELLITTEAYEVIQGLLFPIVLKSVKISPFAKDGDYLYNLELEYDRAYNDQYFSGQFKSINMITSDDLTQGVGVIYEYSDELTYFGYPQNGTSSETENTWRIKQIQKTVVNGKTKHIIKWADGNLNYDNQMSNCMNLIYAYLNS